MSLQYKSKKRAEAEKNIEKDSHLISDEAVKSKLDEANISEGSNPMDKGDYDDFKKFQDKCNGSSAKKYYTVPKLPWLK